MRDPYEETVARMAGQAGAPAAVSSDEPAKNRHRFLTPDGLRSLPPVQWILPGMIPARGKVMAYGEPGCGKTFYFLNAGLAIGAGQGLWFGQELAQGLVVYVGTEGTSGLRSRVEAWLSANPGAVPEILFVPDPVQLLDIANIESFLQQLLAVIGDRVVVLIVFDTLQTNAAGMDGNSDRDGSLVVNSVDYLIKHTGAAVVLLHHPKKNAEFERGTTVWRASMDVMVQIHHQDGHRELRLSKLRDGDWWDPIPFDLQPVGDSCVVVGGGPPPNNARLADSQINAIRTLEAITLVGPASASAWRKSTSPEIPERSFYRIQAKLQELGLVRRAGRGYELTNEGRARLSAITAADVLPATHSTSVVAVADMSSQPVALPRQQSGSGSDLEQERLAIEEEAA